MSYFKYWQEYQAAGGEVAANTEALTLTTLQATIAKTNNVSANTEALTLTTYRAGIDFNLAAATEALTLTTFSAAIVVDPEVRAFTEALTLTTFPATLALNSNVSAATEGLTLTTLSASIDFNLAANTENLTLTTHPVTVGVDSGIQVSYEALTLTSFAATVVVDPEVAAITERLNLTTHRTTVTNTNVVPTVVTRGGYSKVEVTWSGVKTGDKPCEHLVSKIPALVSFQASGTFANGTSVSLVASDDSAEFFTCVDADGAEITGKTDGFLSTVGTNARGFRPKIIDGSADSVTFTLVYWGKPW
jgi:hypothetical protein